MTREEFWSTVAKATGDEAALERALAALEPAEIEAFQAHFDELHAQAYRWDLWGAAYLMEGGCSDDGFIDFRYGLIGLGQRRYEAALANPDSLASVDDMISNESFGYAAQNAYERVTGRRMSRTASQAPAEPLGEQWDFDDEAENRRRLPRLARKYGEA